MIKRIAVTFVLVIGCSLAWARIGETEAQITARYGQSIGDIPTESFGPTRGFALAGFVVGVKLVDGKSAMEMISKNDQSTMTDQEIQGLLKKHGAEMQWNVDRFDKPNWKRWRSQDDSLIAVYDTKRHFLYVNSKQFYDQQGKTMNRAGQEKEQN
jgi:hypothetical protein